MNRESPINADLGGCLLRGHKLCTGTSCLQALRAPDPELLSPYVPLDLPNICRHAGEARQLVREWEHLYCSLQGTSVDAPELLLVCGRLHRARKNWRSFPIGPTVRRLLSTVDIETHLRRFLNGLERKSATLSQEHEGIDISYLSQWDDIEILEAFQRSQGIKAKKQTTTEPQRKFRAKLTQIRVAVCKAARTVRDYSIKVCLAARASLIRSRLWAPTLEKFVTFADGDPR
ncbi:MAG: hypothetical protein R3C18_04630 [Planctomycetaceae bacterium]